jgi:site-specific DNA-methyltransferase (adenine-specific)
MSDGKYAFEKSKIIQGDCLEKMKLIPNGSVDMILCDLPYGTTQNKWDVIIPLERLWEQYERIIKDNGMICLTSAEPFTSTLITSNKKMFKYDLIWDKKLSSGFLNAKRMPLRRHEQILCFYKKLPTYNPEMVTRGKVRKKGITTETGKHTSNYGKFENSVVENNEYYPTSIIEVSNANRKDKLHPTEKPLELFEYLIKTYSNEGELILDNCAGSGTTGEACINLNRDFILIEKDPNYYEVIKGRVGKIFKNYGIDLQPLLNEQM